MEQSLNFLAMGLVTLVLQMLLVKLMVLGTTVQTVLVMSVVLLDKLILHHHSLLGQFQTLITTVWGILSITLALTATVVEAQAPVKQVVSGVMSVALLLVLYVHAQSWQMQ